jgi:hypothetical protein
MLADVNRLGQKYMTHLKHRIYYISMLNGLIDDWYESFTYYNVSVNNSLDA